MQLGRDTDIERTFEFFTGGTFLSLCRLPGNHPQQRGNQTPVQRHFLLRKRWSPSFSKNALICSIWYFFSAFSVAPCGAYKR